MGATTEKLVDYAMGVTYEDLPAETVTATKLKSKASFRAFSAPTGTRVVQNQSSI